MIIGFAGRKQSGKSTAAEFLSEVGFSRYSFAKPMRKMAASLLMDLGLTSNEIGEAYREKEGKIFPIEVSIRHLLQTLGTEWGRQKINPDLWVMCAAHWLQCERVDEDVVIDDVRFENEASLIRNMGGVIVHLRRGESENADDHQSEAGIACRPEDLVILNHGNIDDLHRKVMDAMNEHVAAKAAQV